MISELFIKRPVMTTLVMSTIVIFGLISYKKLPVNSLPSVDFPTIQVSASLPGANPDTMASSVALPLEKQFSSIAGIDSMNSISSQGATSITLQFSLDRTIDSAAQDVQSAISATLKKLPSTMTTPPSYKKINPADLPIYYLSVTSDTMPLYKVNDYAETILAERLSMINGIAQVQVYGSQKYAVRIQLNPEILHTYSIGLDEIEKYITANNVNLPTGILMGTDRTTNIMVNGQLMNGKDYENLILTYRNGSPLYLRDLGNIKESTENEYLAATLNNNKAIVLAIIRQPDTNTIEIVESINKVLPGLRKKIPAGIKIETLYDRSKVIVSSVNDVKLSLGLALILVILVIFIFLRSPSSTLIPSIAIPISIIGTFAGMYYLGYTIDNISLMALTLCVGFVVDDAIVVLENIIRHMEQGKSRMQATLEGSSQIGFTIISMTTSLAAVFLPILFMGGVIGRLLHEFAVTIILAILISGFVSITLTPMMCSLFLNQHDQKSFWILNLFEKLFEYTKAKYQSSLTIIMQYRRTTMLVFFAIFIATGFLFSYISKGFLPDDDTGLIIGITEASQDISFNGMQQLHKAAVESVLDNPHIASIISSLGSSSTMNNGRIVFMLKPKDQRPNSLVVLKELRKKFKNIPGMQVYLQNIPTIRMGTQTSKSQYQYTLQAIDQNELYNFSPLLEAKLRTIPGFLNVTSDLQIKNPQVNIEVNRDKAIEFGITLDQVENTLYRAYGSKQISTIYSSTNQYQVILELLPEFRSDLADLSILTLKSSNGSLVPLKSIAKITNSIGPLNISHLGQLPSVTLSFDLKEGFSLSDAISLVNGANQEINMPETITGSFQGTAQAFMASFDDMGVLMCMAILVIYIILGILYESFIHPITILSGLPTAGFGALITLILFDKQLDMYGLVGMIMLIGIVKKNAIMIIDFAIETIRKDNNEPDKAIYEACIVRFRPIMMTTLAAIFGALPIAIGLGHSGSERSSLGIAIVGGLITSQILTLYITPVIFLYFEKFKLKTQ